MNQSPTLRVAIVAESFLPNTNGVTNSVLRTIEHLHAHGHAVIVIAPGPGDERFDGTPVVRVPSFDVPRYGGDLRIGLPARRIAQALEVFRPDVVHLAAPTVLGAAAARQARRRGIPIVAVFQTDIAGFAARHGLGRVRGGIWSYLTWVHAHADITLAPSSQVAWTLRARGVPNVRIWARGVDLIRFHPDHRNPDLHRFLSPDNEVVVGYIGRLAREKQVERLAPLADLDGVRLVVVGDGPERKRLEGRLGNARFLGFRSGADLSAIHATLDVFVHTGLDETFCQALQESMASGCAVVGPSAGGPLDLIRHCETGYFWSPGAPESLVGAVDDLVRSEERRRQLGMAARADVERRPWDTIMTELIGHYRDAASLSGGRPGRRRAA